MLQRLYFEFMYRLRRPPWDTGITPPEVVSLIEQGEVKQGRALDLGCGTGTNSIYLAHHGFRVVGVDFSSKAIAIARAKAQTEHAKVEFVQSDVTRLEFLQEPFDFVLDIGCFHGIPESERTRYVSQLKRLTQPASIFMLYAFGATGMSAGVIPAGVSDREVGQLFSPFMELCRVEYGTYRGDRTSAWYWFKRA